MPYMVLIVVCLLFAALIAFLAVRLLLDLRWFVGFVRGIVGLSLMAVAAVLAVSAVDCTSYHQIKADQRIGNVSFVKLDEQVFRVTVVDSGGVERRTEINGDLWQPGVRLFEWSGLLKSAGLQPVARFDRIRGRYFSLEQERRARRNEPLLYESSFGVDLWHVGYRNNIALPGITASYRDSTFLPMADGALFELHVTPQGVLATPMNDPAKRAVSEWR